jgi:hypothetical protein
MLLGVITVTIAGIREHRCRRIRASKGPVVDIGPHPAGAGLTLGQHRHGGAVARMRSAAKTWVRISVNSGTSVAAAAPTQAASVESCGAIGQPPPRVACRNEPGGPGGRLIAAL